MQSESLKDRGLPEKQLIGDEFLTSREVRANVARALIAALTKDCKAYCILSGYEQLPESFDTDIDFMVSNRDFQRMPGILYEVAQRTHTRIFLAVDHEITGRAYWLTSLSRGELTVVQPDAAGDYRHFGSLWLRWEEVLASRRLHPRGFWNPAAECEFAYCLVKRLNKKSWNPELGRKLHRLYVEDPSGCNRMIARLWEGRQRSLVMGMAASDEWASMGTHLEALRKEMRQNTAESVWQKALFVPRRLHSFTMRVAQPTGGWIAIMGPDGAGKSLVISTICPQLSSIFRTVRRFHLRPKILRRGGAADALVTDPHGKPPRGKLMSIAKVLFLFADYLFGYLFQLAPAMMRSDMIVFDRYIYDLLVDSKRVRYGGPLWLLRLAARVVPRPDLVIVLDAPAEVLWSRKQEVAFVEVARQRTEYLRVASEIPSTVVVDAAQSPSEVAGSVLGAIVEFYSQRTARRLGLDAAPVSHNSIEAEAPGN
jgi:thymidylate kinase